MMIERLSETSARFSGVPFDPRLTLLDSAQVFHWREENGVFAGVSGGHEARLIPEANGFLLEGCAPGEEAYWTRYFDLERDYAALRTAVAACPMALEALERLPGLRVLRQPPWEALVAFIISANNNVGRIRKIVRALIDGLGEDGAFPTPAALAGAREEALRALGCGYRALFLIRTAGMVADGFALDAVAALNYGEAHARLLRLPGVGDKVADCVQLFGMGHGEAFPVDVWIERAVKGWIAPEAKTKRDIRRAARSLFGENAGLIQQSLFHCARMGLISLDDPQIHLSYKRGGAT
ncbi:MAG: DNA-3-methyladenine glycosylase 2 family protein [Clostridia bacterium]|nr:DNA-3-methyladenine glycosylase 2 family protein [Clostridia bacterium]